MPFSAQHAPKHLARLLLLPVLLTLVWLAGGCRQAAVAEPEPLDPVTDQQAYLARARSFAWGVNLQAGNFFFPSPDGWVYTSLDDRLLLAPYDGSQPLELDPYPGQHLAQSADWLFYLSGNPTDSLKKIKRDGTNPVRIRQTRFHHLIATEEALYGIDTASGTVFAMNLDGTGEHTLLAACATSLFYDGSSLFLCGSEDRTGLIRYCPQSQRFEKLLDHRVVHLNRMGDQLIYADPGRNHQVYAWDLTHKKERLLLDRAVARPFVAVDGFFYYLDTSRQNRLLRRTFLADGSLSEAAVVVIDDVVDSFVFLPDALYYRRPSDRQIFRVPFAGGPAQALFQASAGQ